MYNYTLIIEVEMLYCVTVYRTGCCFINLARIGLCTGNSDCEYIDLFDSIVNFANDL